MRQKAAMSSHVGCQGKLNVEQVARTGWRFKHGKDSSLANPIKIVPECSLKTVVSNDKKVNKNLELLSIIWLNNYYLSVHF